jgi:hypothetical protein
VARGFPGRMEYKSNFLHHILGFVMCNAGLVVIPEHHEPLISRFFVIETSTVCLDIMWVLVCRTCSHPSLPLFLLGNAVVFVGILGPVWFECPLLALYVCYVCVCVSSVVLHPGGCCEPLAGRQLLPTRWPRTAFCT